MSIQGEKRGVKRKRGPFKPEDDDLVGKLSNKLHHAFKEVKKASRKAKSFETQKLVKKLKGLRSDGKPDESKAIEAQLELLKLVEVERIAVVAFRSKLHKDRLLRDNSDIKQALEKELSTFTSPSSVGASPEAKVESRLLSSKVLAQEISAALLALRYTLGIKEGGDVENEDGVDVGNDHNSKAPVRTRAKEDPKPRGRDMLKAAIQTSDGNAEDLRDVEIVDRSDADSVDWESGSVHSNAKDDEDDEDGWESGSIDPDNRSRSLQDESDDDAVEEPQGDSDSDSAEATTSRKIQKRNSSPSGALHKSKASESTFLPSLSVGFIKGDSDASDWSDGEGDIADSNTKKNRRGQRARKAIWEKKYGKNANHLKKQREEMEVSGRGFGHGGVRGRGRGRGRGAGGMGRGAPSDRAFQTQTGGHHNRPAEATGRGSGRGIPQGRFSVPTGSNAIMSQTRSQPRSTDEKPLHPSWEAKKRLKEKQSAAIVPPQGTRLKF